MNTDREALYARAFKHGAEAALDYMAATWPDLATSEVAEATMEYVDGVATLIANPSATEPVA